MTCLNEILKLSSFEQAMVIAGHGGLQKEVKTTTIAEVPDAANWLEGGEIVFTSGYFLSNKPEAEVLAWMESLIHKEATALAIKVSRFIGELPEKVKRYADAHNFPVISLPYGLSWPRIMEEVINFINNNNMVQLQYYQSIQEELTHLLFSGSDIATIARTISEFAGNPIIVEDGRFQLITSSVPSYFAEEQRDIAGRHIQLRRNESFVKTLLQSDYYRQILNKKQSEPYMKALPWDDKVKAVTVPMINNRIIYGFLTLIDSGKAFVPTDLNVLEKGAKAISFLLMNWDKNNPSAEEKNIIQKLMNGYLYPSIVENPSLSTFDWSAPMVIAIIKTNHFDTLKEDGLFVMNDQKQEFETLLRKHVSETFEKCFVASENNQFTLLISLHGIEKKDALFQIKETLTNFRHAIRKKFPHITARTAIGSIYTTRNEFKKSYIDALETLELMETIPTVGEISDYEHTGIYRLIHKIGDYEFLKSFQDDYLSDLIEHDKKNGDVLCETLMEYLRSGGSVTKTAKTMFVHPNTITYRIRKINGIIGERMESPLYRGLYMLALEIKEYLKKLENEQPG